jgi:hypothetical protein
MRMGSDTYFCNPQQKMGECKLNTKTKFSDVEATESPDAALELGC